MSTNEWRRLIAALANDKSRLALAELLVSEAREAGLNLTEAERRKALANLEGAGLIKQDKTFNAAHLRSLLATPDGGQDRDGLARFLVDGRIDRYPSNQDRRRDLLQWVAAQVLAPGATVDEPTLNERLTAFSDDFAVLRRYLVDAELVERTPNGTAYSLVRRRSSSDAAAPLPAL